MDPREALVNMQRYLLDYEKTEIMEYDQIFYINMTEKGTRATPEITADNNNGFDNDRAEYICDNKDHVAYRYEVKKQIGSGSFGQVF